MQGCIPCPQVSAGRCLEARDAQSSQRVPVSSQGPVEGMQRAWAGMTASVLREGTGHPPCRNADSPFRGGCLSCLSHSLVIGKKQKSVSLGFHDVGVRTSISP